MWMTSLTVLGAAFRSHSHSERNIHIRKWIHSFTCDVDVHYYFYFVLFPFQMEKSCSIHHEFIPPSLKFSPNNVSQIRIRRILSTFSILKVSWKNIMNPMILNWTVVCLLYFTLAIGIDMPYAMFVIMKYIKCYYLIVFNLDKVFINFFFGFAIAILKSAKSI